MISSQTLTWFARHELMLAWRDWASMMAGGRTTRERAVTLMTLGFVGFLHWLAYAILNPVLKGGVAIGAPALVMLTSTLLLTFSMMLSQAIEQVTRSFYARADLDLILSSPAPAQHLFAVRIASIALTGMLMTSLLAAPFINTAAAIDGPRWLSAYAVIGALSSFSTGLAVMAAVALYNAVGPKRTRFIAQIVAAVIGAALLIGIQAVAVMTYGNLSRIQVLNSDAVLNAAPDVASMWWIPAKAVLGDASAALALIAAGVVFLVFVIRVYAPRFSEQAIATASVSDEKETNASVKRAFVPRTALQALRAKEWQLLRRDPWLLSQSLMQVLYLIPPALLLLRDMGPNAHVHIVLAPVLVMAFGQLAGGLAWLAISGEDAHDLVATAPVPERALVRAKNEAVLAVIAVGSAPFLFGLAFLSAWAAGVTALGIAVASGTAILIQMWFKVTGRRTLFRRRQMASKAATFSEAFSSIFWAGATGLAAAQSWWAMVFVVFALATLAIARFISPRA